MSKIIIIIIIKKYLILNQKLQDKFVKRNKK